MPPELDGSPRLYDVAGGPRLDRLGPARRSRDGAQLLAARGHALDAAPRAMALDLDDLARQASPLPPGVELRPLDAARCAALNDRAYGFGEDGFRAGFSGETAIRWHGAFDGDEPLACVGTIDAGEDCCVTGVATPPSTAAAASPAGCSGERWRRRGRTAIVTGVAASQSGGRAAL